MRINYRALRFSLSRYLKALGSLLLLLLLELRSLATAVLCVSIGCAMIARVVYPGIEWGVGLSVFGGLSLILRPKDKPAGGGRRGQGEG